jgi:dTDP-4-amino-4,6-dideoxygalactose transaminase
MGLKKRVSPVIAKQRIMPIQYLRAGLGGSRAHEALFVEKMQRRLGETTAIIPLGRARSGIYLLTKLSIKGERRKILLSPYTIPDVVNMVMLAGGVPEFFDFEPASTAVRLSALERAIDEQTAAVFVTHYHVNEPQLEELITVCKQRSVSLFDDCAITFGGSVRGKPIGTLTDASVFSFSAFKVLNFFWGGMISTRDQALAERIEAEVNSWPRLGARDYIGPLRRCLTYDLATQPFVFDKVVYPMFLRKARTAGVPKSLENARIETLSLDSTITSRPALAAFAEWLRKLDWIDDWLAHRRSIAAIYRQRLGEYMVTADRASEDVIVGSCFVNFPIYVDEHSRDTIILEMMEAGFDLGLSLYPNCRTSPRLTNIAGSSDNINALTKRTLYLPTHFGVSEEYADTLSARMTQALVCNCKQDRK